MSKTILMWEGLTPLAYAVKLHQHAAEASKVHPGGDINLEFQDMTDASWCRSGDDSIFYIKDGDVYDYEIRYVEEEDDRYIQFLADNGCGDRYFVVFDKTKEREDYEDLC